MRDGKHSVTDGTQIYAATCSIIRIRRDRSVSRYAYIRALSRIRICIGPWRVVIKERERIKGRGKEKKKKNARVRIPCASSRGNSCAKRSSFSASNGAPISTDRIILPLPRPLFLFLYRYVRLNFSRFTPGYISGTGKIFVDDHIRRILDRWFAEFIRLKLQAEITRESMIFTYIALTHIIIINQNDIS